MKKPLIVAEMSASHLGDMYRVFDIANAAKRAGADMLKVQTWKYDTMVLRDDHVWKGKNLKELYREAWFPWEFHKPLFEHCKGIGLPCFSTPFDKESVDFLEALDCPIYKVASFEIVDLELLAYIAKTGKPMIVSTGMANQFEIVKATDYMKINGAKDITLLKCTSAYPAAYDQVNLAAMPQLGFRRINIKFGLSDHTLCNRVAIAATALGASYIEKHFTLSREDGGPDAEFSLEPAEFEQLVIDCETTARAMGRVTFGPTEGEATDLRRSLHFARDLPAGHILIAEDMCTARPADGVIPRYKTLLVGMVLPDAVRLGDPVLPSST